jgi:DHA2 family multidrug resistance protein
MPIVGGLLKKVQPKYLIMLGLAIECLACLHLHTLDASVSFHQLAWARVFQAVGLPFLFVPLSTVAYAGLPPGKSNSASALINTMRNLGGSFGISVAIAFLSRRGQFHHARLAESISVYSRGFAQYAKMSLAQIDQIVQRQAVLLSYIDIFWFLTLMAACCIPITLLLRKTKAGAPAGH